jgi:proteic killer suppression protein
MRVRSVRHKGLKRLIEDDDDRGIRPHLAGRLRRILTALLSAQDIEGLEGRPGWRIGLPAIGPALEHIRLR